MVGARRGRAADGIAAMAAAMGGNVRVGLEDSLWAGPGPARDEQRRAGARRTPDHRRPGARGREPGRGARDPRAQGRRPGRLLTARPRGSTMLRIELLIDARPRSARGRYGTLPSSAFIGSTPWARKSTPAMLAAAHSEHGTCPSTLARWRCESAAGRSYPFATGSTRSIFRLEPAVSLLIRTPASQGFA